MRIAICGQRFVEEIPHWQIPVSASRLRAWHVLMSVEISQNYYEIRESDGFKNVSLANILGAKSPGTKVSFDSDVGPAVMIF